VYEGLITVLALTALTSCLDANEQTVPDLGVSADVEHVDARRDWGAETDSDNSSDPRENDPGEPECDVDRPCTSPFVCVQGLCRPECEIDDDCGRDRVCSDFVCFERECEDSSGCDRYDEVCGEGLCEDNPCNLFLFVFDPGDTTYSSVHVAGDFNATDEVWPETVADGGWPLELAVDDGIWWGKHDVPNGLYEYKFVLGETEFIADPTNPDREADGFGGFNSVLTVACSGESAICGDVTAFDWRDAVMYFAMVDRFHDSDGRATVVEGATGGDATTGASGQYEGGDLAGVTERIDYLAELGVTALWLTAPYENRDQAGAAVNPDADPHLYSGYHGYWPSPADIDYSDPRSPSPTPEVESRIGTAGDLRALVRAAHRAPSANGHGIRVLFDYVMNHVDIQSGLYQAHTDWFARRDGETVLCGPENLWDDPYWGTRCAFTDYLPPFDFENADARRWSIDDAMWWAQEFEIDGYRLDAIKHVSLSWLTELRTRLNRAIDEPAGGRFYLVGETFAYDDRDLLASFVDPDTMLDGQFDFPLKARLCEALLTQSAGLDDFASWMAQNDGFYGDGSIMTHWIGNHDIPRAIHFASGDIDNCREGSSPANGWTTSFPQPSGAAAYERLGLAFAVLMTNPGIPLIYYGDEVGLAGGGDPDNRRMLPVGDDDLSRPQLDLRDRVAELARIRADNPVLARGRRITRSADSDTWVYTMTGCGDASPAVTVLINRSGESRSLDVPAGDYTDLQTDESIAGGQVVVPGRSVRLFRQSALE
jgi:glycosidase